MSLINIGKTIELDVYDHDTTPSVIKAIQLDEGTRTVSAVIQNSRQDYDIGQNAEVKLTVLRPDKTRVQIVGETFGYNGADGTMYGAKADLSDVALAVKGTCRAQFKLTSGDQILRTEIFAINNGEALDAGDGDWAGDLDGHNLDEMAQDIEDAKAAVSEMETDVSELKSGFSELEEALGVTSAPSKNFNRTPYETATVKGVTITVNSDNSLTLSGAPTGTGNIYYTDDTLEENRWLLPAGTYTLSGGVDAWKVVNLRLYETKTTSDLAIEYSCGTNDGKPVTFTTTQDYYAVARVIINSQNGDLTGVTLYPQVEEGEEKTAYVSPWSGEKTIERLDVMEEQIASAKTSADSAIEDVAEVHVKMAEVEDIADANSDDIDDVKASVGYEKNVISSRNLNKTPYDASYTASGLTVITNEDNTLSLSGDPTANVRWPSTNDPSYRWLLPAGTYTLSGGIDSWAMTQLELFQSHDDTTVAKEYSCGPSDGKAVTFTTEQNYWAYVRIYVDSRNEETSGKTLKPQVEAGTSKTAYQSPWEENVEYNTKITDVEQDINTYKQTRPFARTGNLVQYRPVKDNPVTMRIDFESVDGFTEIRFTHCGRNLLDMQKAIVDGSTKTLNGLTGVKNNGVVHVTGKNTSNGWTKLFDGYMSSNNYWLPAGHYSILKLGLSTKNQDDTTVNESNTFVKTMPWQAVQWYVSVRGGHTVDVDYPLVILSGDERPSEYIPFVGEHVVVSLPQTVYGGWIDINNSVLHVTKNLSNGALVDVEETTYDLDPITLTEIDEINTLYSIDGVVSASGTLVDFSKPDFDMPVPDFYLNDGYLQSKIDRINELAETSLGNGDMFFVITDCHLENNRMYSVPLIRELSKNCNIPRLFNCGDVSDGMYSITKDYLKLVKDNFKGKTHYVFGNHEYMGTPENKMNYWFNLGSDADRHGEFKRNYYYVDNAQSKIRYIILNGYKENTTATNWATGYEEAQRTWLQNEALNVNDGWGIIVFTHNTFLIDWKTGLKSGYDGTTVEAMLNVLDAYDGNGEVIAVFGGHMHIDAVEHTTGGIPVILTTCDKPQPYMSSSGHADFDSSVRIINTISEQAFDVVLIDRDNRTIKLVRIGCPALNLVDDVTDGYVEERTVAFKQLT